MKSIELTNSQIEKFKEVTKNLKHETPHQYELVRIKDGKIVFILYTTKKLVYNDNHETLEYLNKFINNKSNSSRKFHKKNKHYGKKNQYKNNKRYSQNNKSIISYYDFTVGSDETGKGEWYGPLVVTAVSTSHSENIKLREIGVTDSKKLNRKQILKLYEKIEELGISHETLVLKPFSYNKLYKKFRNEGKNLNHLLAYLHSKAINNLVEKIDSNDILIVIDKFDKKKMDSYLDLNDRIKVIQESNGERFTPVATSSIIAKYHFEKSLKEIEEKYNINLRKTKPKYIDYEILDKVAKLHFKNVSCYYYK